VYVLELGGEDDAFAAREAESACSRVRRLAPGLATARGVTERVRGLAYTHAASRLVGTCDPTVADAEHLLRAASIDREGSVAVRARDVRATTGVSTRVVERALGDVLSDRGFAVDLDDPDHELRALFSAGDPGDALDAGSDVGTDAPDAGSDEGTRRWTGVCALGWLACESVRDFGDRTPTERPFVQPGSMDPLLARALANVAGARPGALLVDPMCGTGGLLSEAALVGADVVGVDAQRKMVRGARENLAAALAEGVEGLPEPGAFSVLRGDATRLPLRDEAADAVVFDAPYGRQSKIESSSLETLVGDALAEARRVAPRAVVVGDRSWGDAARDAGWTVDGTFERRVHRSLTRYVHVLTTATEP
jgi:tRNA (guanine10-N2)-dimethyltransferase